MSFFLPLYVLRLYIYGSLSWHWFLVDFCYFSNFACVWGIVGAPASTTLLIMNFAHTSGAPAWSKCRPWQRPGSASVPPQGAPGGSGQLGTPRKRSSLWNLSHCLELAASKAAQFTAFDHPGAALCQGLAARAGSDQGGPYEQRGAHRRSVQRMGHRQERHCLQGGVPQGSSSSSSSKLQPQPQPPPALALNLTPALTAGDASARPVRGGP